MAMPKREVPAIVKADPEFDQLEDLIEATLSDAKALKITTAEEYAAVAEYVRDELKPRMRDIEAFFAKIKKPLNDTRNAVLALERERTTALESAIAALNAALVAYDREQKRIREEAERLAREQAQKVQETRIAEQVTKLEGMGLTEAAEELAAATPIAPMAAPVAPEVGAVPKIEGVHTTTHWKAQVLDVARFIRWVAQDPENRAHYITPNQKALDETARAQRKAFTIPGCTAVPSESKTFRKV